MKEEHYKLHLGEDFLDTTPNPPLTIKKRIVIDMVSGERKTPQHLKRLIWWWKCVGE